MTIVAACILTPDAQRAAVIEAVAHLTPGYVLGFARKVCPIDPEPTPATSPTHWRAHDDAINQATAALWQAVAEDGALPDGFALPEEPTMTEQEIIDAMDGVKVWIGPSDSNTNAWAAANMNPLGLRDVPDIDW